MQRRFIGDAPCKQNGEAGDGLLLCRTRMRRAAPTGLPAQKEAVSEYQKKDNRSSDVFT